MPTLKVVANVFKTCEMAGMISVVLVHSYKCKPTTLGYSLAMLLGMRVSLHNPLTIVPMDVMLTLKVVASKFETCEKVGIMSVVLVSSYLCKPNALGYSPARLGSPLSLCYNSAANAWCEAGFVE